MVLAGTINVSPGTGSSPLVGSYATTNTSVTVNFGQRPLQPKPSVEWWHIRLELHQALAMKSLTLLMARTLLAIVLLQERFGDF